MRGRTIRTRRTATTLAVFTALVAAASASAAGGRSIASAPLVTPGATMSLNSATDAAASADRIGQGCFNSIQYWGLALGAGDEVEIRMREELGASGFVLLVFAPGTTDRNIASVEPIGQARTAGRRLTFHADAAGVYPLIAGPACYIGVDGPFSFVATVTRSTAAVVTLPPVARVPAAGPIVASVRTKGGSPITDKALVLKLYGTWKDNPSGPPASHLLGTARAAGGSARFDVRFPAKLRGTTVTLRATGQGAGYHAAPSAARRVTVG